MTMTTLEQKLRERNHRRPDAIAFLEAWQTSVSGLCAQIEGYLEPLRAKGDVQIDHHIDEITEIELGTYKTKGLGLRFTGIPGTVYLRAKSALSVSLRLPSGEWRHNVNGLVDLDYGALRLHLTRAKGGNGAWSIGLGNKLVGLREASLEQAIELLLGL